MTRLLAAAVLALASCSGGHTASHHPNPDPIAVPAHPADSAPDVAECDALIAHAIALGMVDQRAKPPDRVPTDEQQAKAKAELRTEYGPSCRAMSRRSYQCAIVASTISSLAACDQASLSSSTSKSSVALPGITPPAPRSP